MSLKHNRTYTVKYTNGVNVCTISRMDPPDFEGTAGDTWLVLDAELDEPAIGWNLRHDLVWVEANITAADLKLYEDLRSSEDVGTIVLDERFKSRSARATRTVSYMKTDPAATSRAITGDLWFKSGTSASPVPYTRLGGVWSPLTGTATSPKHTPTHLNKKEDNTHMTNNEGMAVKAENSITEEQLFESNKRVMAEVILPVLTASAVRFGVIHLIGRKLFPQVFTGLGRSMAITYLVSMMTGKLKPTKEMKSVMEENKFLRDSISR